MVSFDIAAKRQLEGMQRAGQRLAEGYAAQKEHPGEKAARNEAGYVQGVQRSVKKWARNVATKHSLSELIARMNSKGATAYAGSAATANQAYRKNTNDWYQVIERIKADIDARLPRGDDARNMQRSAEFQRLMIEERNRRNGM